MTDSPEPRPPKPAAHCDVYGCELYPGDLCFAVEGLLVCGECIGPFVRRWLEPRRRVMGEGGLLCTPS
ncbi:MAG: hypothetical protein LBT60_04475 [Oscillospiraceae bacterium]|jgi:hypothetical protein|nr:hypothetical protein [Oscillospiraceae bacterium]